MDEGEFEGRRLYIGRSAGARELEAPKYICDAPCLPTAEYGGFPPALSSPVMINCPQVGVVKVT